MFRLRAITGGGLRRYAAHLISTNPSPDQQLPTAAGGRRVMNLPTRR
jgi:hypothetical protein